MYLGGHPLSSYELEQIKPGFSVFNLPMKEQPVL